MEGLRGHLLISSANLVDPNFRRTVVLIGHHDEEGAVGVVLNRVSEVSVADAVPALGPLVPPEERLFIGGPVQPQAAVVLADLEHPERVDVVAFGSIGFLPEEVDPEVLGPVLRARVFAGYAGWGAGQLEAELQDGSWIVEPALPGDVFAEDAEARWSRVLRRKGSSFALMASMPFDPSQN